ncbi:MAG: sigma-54-dependent transcriptional regulator [Spirochaetaceae bacterium]
MRVLIADDEKNIRRTVAEYLELDGIECREAENGLSAQKALSEEHFDGFIVDLRMPGMNGLELLHRLREEGRDVPTVMISAYGEIADAVAAMKTGAADYVTKPFDPEDLLMRLKRAVEDHRLRRLASVDRPREPELEFASAAMQQVLEMAHRVAPTDSTVLITGESGTGKEVLARRIHEASPRTDSPFVPINIGGIPEQLIESELFGYEKGAFTGADSRKQGMLEVAGGGTAFLDEIGDMPPHLQVKLLRVVQERRVQRLGATGTVPIDVRFIAATNADLEARVADGRFREDLFYRLNVIRLHLPPLRDRPEDIPLLARHFLEVMRERTGTRVSALSAAAVRALQAYPFPGNIRELENMVERAVILADTTELGPADFGLSAPSGGAARATGPAADSAGRSLREIERQAIVDALQRNEWHRERTARELGITRRTLLNKIREFGLGLGRNG